MTTKRAENTSSLAVASLLRDKIDDIKILSLCGQQTWQELTQQVKKMFKADASKGVT